jgi:predicted RNA polymerase sigma factor
MKRADAHGSAETVPTNLESARLESARLESARLESARLESARLESAEATEADGAARRTIELVARASYGRLIAFLSARTGDVAGAEDALGGALLSALDTWLSDGVPQNPEGWLVTAARRRLIDGIRRERVRSERQPALALIAAESEATWPEPVPDERLELLFVCAHPAIDPDISTPLMLQTVLGLDAAEIARAFLVSPAAMRQRLVRAKTKIRRAGIRFEVPEEQAWPERLAAVLDAIYGAYGRAWEDPAGVDARHRGLAEEAIWLARLLRQRLPEEPEVRGLLALMLHCEARRPARRREGRFVPLSEQEPTLWVRAYLQEAEQELAAAAALARVGRYQLEAAIQSVHAERAHGGATDWRAVALFHSQLVRLSPTVGALVAQAAAVGEVEGAGAALALLDAIAPALVVSYQPYWAVRAHLLSRLERRALASEAFDRAIGLTEDDAVRRYLIERRR